MAAKASKHAVLHEGSGVKTALLGNHAIVRGALEAGVRFVSGYPGTPASEIGDAFARIHDASNILFEYSVNEKIALETAFAASLSGVRALTSMKHLGLNYALDPASTMPYVGVEGGLVIVSAGDPAALTSPNEQDQRHFTSFLYYPIFDPTTPDDALKMTRFAFGLSEETRLPVIVRPTTRVCHTSGMVRLGPLPAERQSARFRKNPARYVPIPPNARRMRVELKQRYRLAEKMLSESPFFPRLGTGRHGILASGVAHTYAAQVVRDLGLEAQVTVQQVGAYPVPDELLVDFLAAVDRVLVVEELTPFLEDWLTRVAFREGRLIPILGKRTGHFPEEYEYDPDLVETKIREFVGLEARPPVSTPAPDLPERPPVLCPGCSHRATFHLVKRVFGKKTVYCNDIGCYTLGYGEPFDCCDVLLCMGSSITQASGIARTTAQRTVAFIGDSTFFHSGLPALANAKQTSADVTVVVLDNHVTAMTGFQPSLTTHADRFSIEDAVRGLGVDAVTSVDPFDDDAALAALKTAKASVGVSVLIFNSPCIVNVTRRGEIEPQAPLTIEQELCDACSLCVRMIGCPGIQVTEDGYCIDPTLCTGCELCADVCRLDAIHEVRDHG